MFSPPVERLAGLSLDVAEKYGKPHIGATYYREHIKATKRTASNCAVCGRRGSNVHHIAPRSKGRSFLLATSWGKFVLLPSLVLLCGSGTTGCHGAVHSRLLRVDWVWDDDKYAEQWWDGYTLSHGFSAYDKRLYWQGCWRFTKQDGTYMEVRDV